MIPDTHIIYPIDDEITYLLFYKFVIAVKWNKYVNLHPDSLPGRIWKKRPYTFHDN